MEQPALWSAAFTKSLYRDANLNEITIAVGSIMQEVLIWKPFKNQPVSHRLISHKVSDPCCNFRISRWTEEFRQGSIFGVGFSPDSTRLASVSDDRCVRVWTLKSTNTLWPE